MVTKMPWDDEMRKVIEQIKCGKIKIPQYVKQMTVLTENSTKLILKSTGSYELADRPTFLPKITRQITELWTPFGVVPQSGLEAYHHSFAELKHRHDSNVSLIDDDLIDFLKKYYETNWGYDAVSFNNKSKTLTMDVPSELRIRLVNRKKGFPKMMEFLFAECAFIDREKSIKTLLKLSVQNLDPWMIEYLIINEEPTLQLLDHNEELVVSLYELLDKAVQDFINQTPYKPRKIKEANLAENASHILWILCACNDYSYSGETVFSDHPNCWTRGGRVCPAIEINRGIWNPRWPLYYFYKEVLLRREKALAKKKCVSFCHYSNGL